MFHYVNTFKLLIEPGSAVVAGGVWLRPDADFRV